MRHSSFVYVYFTKETGCQFNIKTIFSWYRDYHDTNKTAMKSSYLCNGDSYTDVIFILK